MKPKSAFIKGRLSSPLEKIRTLSKPKNSEETTLYPTKNDLGNYLQIINQRNGLISNHKKRCAPKSSYGRVYYCLNYVPKRKIKEELELNLKNNSNFISTGEGSTTNGILHKKNEKFVWNQLIDSDIKSKNYTDKPKNNNNLLNKYITYDEGEFFEFRNASILKYAKFDDLMQRYIKYTDYLSNDQKNIAYDIFSQLIKVYKANNQIIFSKLNLKELLTYDNWKNNVNLYIEYIDISLKLINLMFTDIKKYKEENLNLQNKCIEQKNLLENKSNEIEEINKYLERFRLATPQSKLRNLEKLSQKEASNEFKHRENAYILTIYKLEEELKSLTKLLQENQIKIENVKEAEDKYQNAVFEKGENEKLFVREKEDLTIQMSLLNEKNCYLKNKSEELENKTKELEDENEKKTIEIIGLNARIESMKETNKLLVDELNRKKDEIYQIQLDKKEEETNKKHFQESSKNDEINFNRDNSDSLI